MGILDDAKSVLGVSDLFTLYKGLNQVKIDNAYAESNNTINELNASATLLRLQNQAIQLQTGSLNPNAASQTGKMVGYALLGVAVLATGYLLVKK